MRGWPLVQRAGLFFTPLKLLSLITLLGALLRIYRVEALSLWLDEGFTIYYSRLPWPVVLGLDGAYDAHPPLYYTLVKLISVLVPEVVAGRLLSVVAGTLTIPIFYALVTRLTRPGVAVLASLLLAVSPLHIWYSQEARQYVLVVLFVCTSYLALIAFHPGVHRGWVLLYFGTLLLSLYVEYSAIYALLPQSLILVGNLRRYGKRAIPIGAAAVAAAVGFLPWLPQLLHAPAYLGDPTRLIVTPPRIASALLSIMGLAEPLQGQSELGGALSTGASLTPGALLVYGLLVVGALPAILLGFVVLRTVSPASVLVMLCLLVGTVVTAVLLSLIYPGYVKRTLLSAILGWSLLVGAAPFVGGRSLSLRLVGRASFAFCFSVALVVLTITYATADKQHWRELAVATLTATTQARSVSAGETLLITYPAVTATLLAVYTPHILDGPHLQLNDGGMLPPLPGGGKAPAAIWVAYIEAPGIDAVRQQLQLLGYQRLSHQAYPGTLYLDAYHLP